MLGTIWKQHAEVYIGVLKGVETSKLKPTPAVALIWLFTLCSTFNRTACLQLCMPKQIRKKKQKKIERKTKRKRKMRLTGLVATTIFTSNTNILIILHYCEFVELAARV